MGKIIIRRMETEEELRGKAYVHCQAWKEAYAGIVDQAFLERQDRGNVREDGP